MKQNKQTVEVELVHRRRELRKTNELKMITMFQDFKKAAYHVANPYAVDVLQTKKKDLVYGIVHTAELLDRLVTEDVMTTRRKAIILAMRTRHEQNTRILEVVEANGERACRRFIHPCLMKAQPELYYQICAYVMALNEHIRDTRRQLIGYLLEQDQDIMHEVIKRQANQRTNVVLVLKEDSFKKEIAAPQLEPARTKAEKSFNTDVGKTAEREERADHNLDNKTQEELIQQETPRMENVRSIEAMEQQTSKQETLDNKDNTEDALALHRAAQEDDWKKLECLLQNGAQIEARDEQNKTALFYAVAKGHEKTIKALLEVGAKVDSEIINEAIKLNQKSVFKMLFDNTRAAVSEEDLNTAIFSAVRQNKDTALLALIDREANSINICDEQGHTPLLLSAEMGHAEVFRVIIERQVNLNTTLSTNRSSVLHLAVQGGSVSIVEQLLEKGLNPNITGHKAQTPLHVAAALNKLDIVKSLLKAGVQVNATAQDGVTPLHVASQNGNEEIVACLIKNKAKIEAVDKLGRTALHWVAVAPKESTIVNELLSAKVNVNALDNEKRSALTVASLLSHKGKAGAKDKNGSTPMHYAAAGGHVGIVSALLQAQKKKGLEERNTWKKTALHVAAEKGHSDVVTLLLETGAKINSKDQNKDTPLHSAARGGHQEVVRRLVEWGQGSSQKKRADLQATNSVGKTALQLAQNGDTPEHESIATLLKRKMLLVK